VEPTKFCVVVPGPIWEPIFGQQAVIICHPALALPQLALGFVTRGCSKNKYIGLVSEDRSLHCCSGIINYFVD
jgi:hypothetical protein